MNIKRPYLVELLTAIALILAPFVLPWLGFSPSTINRILIWGLFGLGFDILFGYTGLLSFGQSAFYGTGGMFAAYLLTEANFPYVIVAIVLGAVVAGVVGCFIGLIALRRTGIYFAMITVAIAEVFFFVEFNPLDPDESHRCLVFLPSQIGATIANRFSDLIQSRVKQLADSGLRPVIFSSFGLQRKSV